MILGRDDSESILRKRVQEDSRFFSMIFSSSGYSEDVFELKIKDITRYYKDEEYAIEKIIFFEKNGRIYARINMRKNEEIIEPN